MMKHTFPFPLFSNPLDKVFRNFHDVPKLMLDSIPSTNIKEEKNAYQIDMAAPGFKKEDFHIDVDGNIVTIGCEKESTAKEYSRVEFDFSNFSRSFTVPENADINKISAKYTDGILTLNIPKKTQEEQKAKSKIKID